MKRFFEYDITDEEIQKMFISGRDSYDTIIQYLSSYPDRDFERLHIAHLLFIRGDREESRKILDGIENNAVKRTYLRHYDWWENEAAGDNAPKRDDD